MFEHRFLPLKNDDSFRNPPPPPFKDNHRACDHNAMPAFPHEQISHYTTGHTPVTPAPLLLENRLTSPCVAC